MEILDYPTLYKYCSFGAEYSLDAIKRAIVESELYWQSPLSFNDPFDCLPFVIRGESEAAWRAYAKEAVNRKRPNAARNDRRFERRRVAALAHDVARELVQDVLAKRALTCFTTQCDNILMWSHYAANHTGICFRFQQLGRPEPFVGLNVIYSDERPVADITRMSETGHDFLTAAVLTKAKCWEYEQEKRMIADDDGPGYRAFPSAALTGVILGSKIANANRELVEEMVQEHRPDLEILRAEIDHRHYRINILPA